MKLFNPLLLSGLLLTPAAQAVVVAGDAGSYVVQGGLCTGTDCVNNESFVQASGERPDLAVKLKENNLRLTFTDTDAPTTMLRYQDDAAVAGGYYFDHEWGNSWWMTGNDSNNGGASYFSISISAAITGPGLSDGTAPEYECTGPIQSPVITATGNLIPEGEQAYAPTLDYGAYFRDGTIQCQAITTTTTGVRTRASVALLLGPRLSTSETDPVSGDTVTYDVPSSVTLGFDSETTVGNVSVGSVSSPRRVSALAQAVNDLDVITREQLQDLPYAAQKRLVASITEQVAALEARVTRIEEGVASVPVFPVIAAQQVVEGQALSLQLSATDSTGDTLTFAAAQPLPGWLSLTAAGLLAGTPADADVGQVTLALTVDDGYGNVVPQSLSVTVIDAEIYVISSAAGTINTITAVQLNAVAGVDNALAENESRYRAALAMLSSTAVDTAEEIAALVASLNSVPVITSSADIRIQPGTLTEIRVSATDAAGDAVSFFVSSAPAWVSLTSGDNSLLKLNPGAADSGTFTFTLSVSDTYNLGSSQTVTVRVNHLAQGGVSGDAVVGHALAAQVTDTDGLTGSSFSYVWHVNGADVATTADYLIQAADAGYPVSVTVSFTDDLGFSETMSASSATVLTVAEASANTIQAAAEGGNVPELEDYLNIGISSVTESELERILSILNRAVAAQNDAAAVDSNSEIDALIATIMEGQDDDLDGLPNLLEGDDSVDTDHDGIADRDDADADNDGIRDNLEYGPLLRDLTDQDADGIVDIFDAFIEGVSVTAFIDDNLDGVRDDRDTQAELIAAFATSLLGLSDPMGLLVGVSLADLDADGVINSRDADSDNDGVPDLTEAGLGDQDGNGQLDAGTALIADFYGLPDTDLDGVPDLYELFSNGADRDLILAGIRAALDQDGDGRIDSTTDIDLDGLMDVIDNAIGAFGSIPDVDGDGIPNHLDDDDDGDGIPDSVENTQQRWFSGYDADADGIDDGVDAEVNGVLSGLDVNGNGVRDDRELPDLDGDGIADYLDLDADNDGIPDNLDPEIALPVAEESPVLDADGDGVPDSEDVSINAGTDVEIGGGSVSGLMLILAAVLVLMRQRRLIVAAITMLSISGAVQAADFSAGLGVGFSRFDPQLNIEPTQTDFGSGNAQLNLAWYPHDEFGVRVSLMDLGSASVNTAEIDYSATSGMLEYRPAALSAGNWTMLFGATLTQVEASAGRGLNVDASSDWAPGFSVGADFQVKEDERLEIILSRLTSDITTLTFGYRLMFTAF